MRLEHPVVRAAALAGCLGLLLAVYFAIARPWFRRWGATDAEVSMALPGDEIVPAATSRETRAITIASPARYVWPWLAQIGQDRAGFYSYQVLENLVGCPPGKTPSPRQVGAKLKAYRRRNVRGAYLDTNPNEPRRTGAVWRLRNA